MLAHLKQYAERYFGDPVNMVNMTRTDIEGSGTRPWSKSSELQAQWCEFL